MSWNSWIWCIVIVVAVVLWLKINQRMFRDNVSPFNLLMFGWVGPLLVRGLNLSDLEQPWSTEVRWLVAWTTVVLVIPCLIRRKLPDFRQASIRETWQKEVSAVLNNRRFKQIVLFTFVISFCAFIYNEFVRSPIGIPLISLHYDPSLVGEAYHIFGKTRDTRSWALYLYLPIHLQCGLLYLIGRVSSKKEGKWWMLLSLLYPFMTVLKLSRTDLVQALSVLLIAEYYFAKFASSDPKPRRSIIALVKRYPLMASSLVILFVGVTVLERQFEELRQGEGVSVIFQDSIGTNIHVGSTSIDTFLAQAYGYFGMPWENFADTHDSIRPRFRPGVGALRPIYALFGQGPALDRTLDQIGFDPADYAGAGHTGPINTYPFITILYLESGTFGIIIFPIIYSIFVNQIYINFRRKPNFLNFFLYLQMPLAWMWLFSNATFTGLHFYLTMLFIWGLSWSYRKFCLPPTRSLSLADRSQLARQHAAEA